MASSVHANFATAAHNKGRTAENLRLRTAEYVVPFKTKPQEADNICYLLTAISRISAQTAISYVCRITEHYEKL